MELEFKDGVAEFTLPDGKIATVKKPLIKHSIKAAKMADGNSELVTAALACQLLTIEGKGLTMEDFGELPMEYLQPLMAAFGLMGK
jgi:hypothetical protein